MKLLTKEILKKLPPIYSTQDQNLAEVRVITKFFNPCSSSSWYACEFDPRDGLFFGFVNLGDDQMAELGYFSLKEFEEHNEHSFFGIERDKYWDDTITLDEVMKFKKR